MFTENHIIKKKKFYGVKSVHLRNLALLLKELLFAHDFQMAGQVINILLCHYKHFKEIIVKSGIEVMRSLPTTFHEQIVQFYRRLVALDKKKNTSLRTTFILEFAFYYMRKGFFKEAVDTLSSYLTVDPYKTNPLFHGYCGLACYMQWERELQTLATILGKEEVKYSEMQDKTMALYRQARMNLEQSIRLLPSCDSFLFYYVKLLVFNEEYDVALDALERFRDISPNHPNAYRYLARFYEFYFPDKTQQRLHALRKWIELDPNNDEAFYQLTTFYENGMISLNEIIDITINRIDYNVDDVTLWRFFISLLFNKISSNAQPENRNYIIHDNSASVEEELYRSNVLNESDENEWMKKLHWWRESLLFPSTRQINTNISGDEILCLRGLCSLLLFGRKNNRSYYLILRHFESQNQLNKIEEIFSQFGISILPCELQMCTSAEMESSSDETEDNNNGSPDK